METNALLKPHILLPAALSLCLLAGLAPAGSQPAPFPELDPNLEPLRSRFNQDVGKVRLLLLLDPT